MPAETVTQVKVRIRHARRLMRELRAAVNRCPLSRVPVAIHLNRSDFDALEWGLSHLLKDWVYDEYDADGNPVPGTDRLVRMPGNFAPTNDLSAFMFKGIPVRCAEPEGLQFG